MTVLGIAIHYYNNSKEAEEAFKEFMSIDLVHQITDNVIVYIYEDGQVSEWLNKYKVIPNITIESCSINNGISYARNKCLEYLKDKADYILFLDSDDIISSNYIEEMYKLCSLNKYDIIESTFTRHGVVHEYKDNEVRSCVAGSAFKSSMLGDLRFDLNLQVGEDTKFFKELVDLKKHKKVHCKDAIYYYNYGVNPNSLIMRFNRKEISKER